MNKKQAEALATELGLDISNLIDIGDGMWMHRTPVTVSPKKAKEWLDGHNIDNRTPKDRIVEKMTQDHNNGYWHTTHQGIAFRDDKKTHPVTGKDVHPLGDGQNRLMSGVRSNKSFKVRIYFGLTKEAMLAIDGNAPRTPLDALKLQGVVNINRPRISALKFFLGGRRGEADLGNESIMNKLAEWKTVLDFVFQAIPKNGKGITAGVRAAIMRAYYHCQKDANMVGRISTFCSCLSTGQNISDAHVAKLHRDLLSRKQGGKQDYGGQGRKEIYAHVEDVLAYFLANLPNTKPTKSYEELWPLPHEHGPNGQVI